MQPCLPYLKLKNVKQFRKSDGLVIRDPDCEAKS